MISRSHRVFRVLAASLIVAAAAAHALEPSTPLARFSRQSWSIENGLPQNTVPVLAQDRSGYLWIGTELGAARFDGTAFEILDRTRFSSPAEAEIRCLLSARDTKDANGHGTLWIGSGDGLLDWKNGASTLYTTSDGLPANTIDSLAQSTDGTIWALTERGLARLAVKSFEKVTDSEIDSLGALHSIAAANNGDLWVAGSRGVAVLRTAKWQRDPRVSGSSNGPALVAPASDGSVLIATSEGVYLAANSSITQVLDRQSMPPDAVSFLARLVDGSIAVASKSVLVVARNGTARSQHEGDRPYRETEGFNAAQRFTVAKELPGTRIETLYPDREGTLWVGTNHGLARMTVSPQGMSMQVLPPTDPLAVDATVSLLEDREGDLWVGTETTGLHVLRDSRFRMIGSSDGLSSDAATAVVQDAKGALWIGTRESGLNRIAPSSKLLLSTVADQPSTKVLQSRTGNLAAYDTENSKGMTNLTSANGLLSDVILALAAAPNGDLWVGTPDGLNRISATRGKIDSFTSADGLPDDFIRSLLVEPDGSLWIGTRRGLTHLDHPEDPLHSVFHTLSQSDGLGSDLVGALARSTDGDLWIATLNGLSRLHEDSLHHANLRNYTTKDGLSSNVITALDITADGIVWIGTQDNGLNLWDGTQFKRVEQADRAGAFPTVIHAVLQDDRGHLWLASDRGLTRVATSQLLDCLKRGQCDAKSSHLVDFTTADGLRSRETSNNSHPTAVRLRNGELWFATPRGVAVVDPDHFAPMPPDPPVVIERFSVDDKLIDPALDRSAEGHTDQPVRIAAGHLRFQFDYAGLSFAAPQKLRYQYILEGFDHNWTDAGTRKTAYYTNIPPGTYRFLVRAYFGQSPLVPSMTPYDALNSVSYGVSQASLTFQLLPRFYQTWWFRVLLALAIAGLIVVVFRRRVLRVRRELGAVMAERNRIAREIHDTLAQGYVGISLQLEMLGELLRHGRSDAASKLLVATQGLVREGLDDARQSIWALRSHDAGEDTLPVRLRRLVEKAHSSDRTATLEVHGAYRALPAESEKEVLRIAQEAIQNVKRHSHAKNMSVQLDYHEHEVELSITDDGRGFALAPEDGAAGKKSGRNESYKRAANGNSGGSTGQHFGLTGIQERAAAIHAKIDIVSEPSQGTRITLKVPAPLVPSRKELDAIDAPQDSEESKSKEHL